MTEPQTWTLVTSEDDLQAMMQALRAQSAIAVDTESNSLYAYRERVCLIQISVPGADYIVDPLAGLDLSPLGEVFADPGIQKVFPRGGAGHRRPEAGLRVSLRQSV
jgi:ribonuclease D